MRPRIQLLFGDTAGVGPELCTKVIQDLPDEVRKIQIILTGDGRVFEEAQKVLGVSLDLPTYSSFDQIDRCEDPLVFWDFRTEDTDGIPRGKVSKAAGREVLNALMLSIGLAKSGGIDGMVFAPFNKESMHMGGARHSSELELFKDEFDRPDIAGEFNILDNLWLARVTSHIAVSRIADNLDIDKIAHTIELLALEQEQAGISPRLAIAALNPHGGENGMFGDEEARLITPAIELIRRKQPGWFLEGPMPSDTLFPRALKGGFTGVVGMYHDQLQIASKLIGLERGVTLHPGMKVPIATAAHGTAFDIRGTGKANHQALKNALSLVAGMVKSL